MDHSSVDVSNVVKNRKEVAGARYKLVVALLADLRDALPDDARRIEIDIEYADGGRVKMESKA